MRLDENTGVLSFYAACDECGICGKSHKTESCNFIDPTLDIVKDTPTKPHAQLTLPHGLEVKTLIGNKRSVFAKDPFSKGVQFGPFIAKTSSLMDMRIDFPLKIFLSDDEAVYLETYDEKFCNWMCYVNHANSYEEQNLICYQNHDSIYFCSIRPISQGEELKVGYSPYYAKKMRFNPLTICNKEPQQISKFAQNEIPTSSKLNLLDMTVMEENYCRSILRTRKLPERTTLMTWDCKACGLIDMTVEVYAKHLMTHIRSTLSPYTCPFCPKKFRKDGYNRKIHLSTCKANPDRTKKENCVVGQCLPAELKGSDSSSIPAKSTYELDHQSWSEDLVRNNSTDSGSLGDDIVKSQLNTPILDLCDDIDFNKINSDCTVEKNIFESELKSTDFDFEFPSDIVSQVPNVEGVFYSDGEAQNFINANFPTCIDVTDQEKEEMLNILILQGTQEMNAVVNEDKGDSTNSDMFCNKEEKEINTSKNGNIMQNTASLKCEICQKSFWKETNLYRHLRKHTGEFKCKSCCKVFGRNENLQQHMRNCKVEFSTRKKYVCRICKKMFKELDNLHTHYAVHWCEGTNWICCCGMESDNLNLSLSHQCLTKVIICKRCNKSFETPQAFIEHKQKPSKRLYKASKEILCDICGAVSNSSSSARSHKLKHDEKKFSCIECDKKFCRKDMLQQHMLVHEEYKWECNICLKKFSRKRTLQNHQTKCISNILDCIYCDKIFKEKSGLTRHMKMHIPSSAVSCKLCKREFADNGALNKHTAKAHPKLPNNEEQHARTLIKHRERYKCEFCEMNIGYRQSLRRHLRNKHPDRKIEWNSEEAIDSMMTERYKEYKARKPNCNKRKKDDMQSNVRNINYTIQEADLLVNDEALNIDKGNEDNGCKPNMKKIKIENKDDMSFKQEVKQNIMFTEQSSVVLISDESPNEEEVLEVSEMNECTIENNTEVSEMNECTIENNTEVSEMNECTIENNTEYAESQLITLTSMDSVFNSGQIQLYGSDMEQVLFSSSISLLENVQVETVQSLAIDEERIVDIDLDDGAVFPLENFFIQSEELG